MHQMTVLKYLIKIGILPKLYHLLDDKEKKKRNLLDFTKYCPRG